MAFVWAAVVGGIEIAPAEFRAPGGAPGVGGVGADQAGRAGQGLGLEISADISSRQPERPEADDHQVGEILADAAAMKIIYSFVAIASAGRVQANAAHTHNKRRRVGGKTARCRAVPMPARGLRFRPSGTSNHRFLPRVIFFPW
jgi:hypothetical protein